jgi:glycosyltransferase involved in cell wall biosynthesis
MNRLKVLLIHSTYQKRGGEDTVVENEMQLLKEQCATDLLLFDNSKKTICNLLLYPFNYFSYKKVLKKISEFKPDIIHIHNLHFAASPSVVWAAKKKKVPITLTLHNYRLIIPSGVFSYGNKNFEQCIDKRFPWHAVYGGVYRNSKLLSFWVAYTIWFNEIIGTWNKVNKYILLNKTSLVAFKGKKFVYDNNVIKPNFVVDNNSPQLNRENHFLFVGRLSEEKGIELILSAWSKLPYKITIIGDGPLKGNVEQAAKENSNINYVGFKEKEYIQDEMCKCSALIFPSLAYETFGLTLLEAFAACTPVIASNFGSASDLIENDYNGLHFEAGNEFDLIKKVRYWNSLSFEVKQAFGKNAYQAYVRNYTPENNLEQLLTIYHSIIDKKAELL